MSHCFQRWKINGKITKLETQTPKLLCFPPSPPPAPSRTVAVSEANQNLQTQRCCCYVVSRLSRNVKLSLIRKPISENLEPSFVFYSSSQFHFLRRLLKLYLDLVWMVQNSLLPMGNKLHINPGSRQISFSNDYEMFRLGPPEHIFLAFKTRNWKSCLWRCIPE
ncbi:hypothetical protein SLE2022_205600 [Rubroshorea leprosula]